MNLGFIKNPTTVLIHRPTGVGKIYLATAIGNQACRKGYTCIFVGMNELIERIELARAEGTFLKYRDRLIKTDCLILDDLGIKPLPATMVQDLYDVLEKRYQNRCTIITSQPPTDNWKEVVEIERAPDTREDQTQVALLREIPRLPFWKPGNIPIIRHLP